VLAQLIYIAVNVFCFSFRASSISQAGLRAGTLSIVNLIPLFAGLHISFLADLLGVTLATFRQIHRSAGVMSVLLALFHVPVAVASRSSFALALPQNLFAVIVSALLQVMIRPATDYIGSIDALLRPPAVPPALSQTFV